MTVYIGKSEDVRTDTSFVELTVGDPDVADVNPLTDRSLSILGKKNGTTRVSAYAEGKKLIGVFDVEVVYDTSLLQTEIRRRFPHASLRVSSVNGRIMLSGTAPDGPTVDKAVPIAKQFGPDVINTVKCCRRSRSCWRCASSKPRATPAAISACSGTCSASTISPTSATARRATASGHQLRRQLFSQPASTAANVGIGRHLTGRRGRRAVGHRAVRRDRQQADRRRASRPT